MTRRFAALPLLAALLVTTSVAPVATLATDPVPDGSVTTDSGRVLPPLPVELLEPSIHAEMLAGEGAGAFDFELGGEPTVVLDAGGAPKLTTADGLAAAGVDGSVGTLAAPLTTAGLPNGLRKEVFGFLPYWMLTDAALSSLNYSLVSTIAYFSVGLGADGYLSDGTSSGWAGWTSSRMTQVLDRAHANGVKVVLTVTHMAWNGDYSRMTDLLTSATRRNRAVNQIVAAVVARGADGVNLDFEPVPTSLRDEYVAFVRQLKAGLAAAGPGDFLTVCVMAGAATWATGYDVARLTAGGAADALFVMGYDYHWSGSSRAGGVAPIESPYTIDVNGTMLDFLAETSGSKLIWGVPYYGREWPTTSGTLNSTTRGGSSVALTYTGHLAQAARYGRRWDDVGMVPWYRWKNASGGWSQGYYDDPASLGVKYDLVNVRGLRGTGMWTLLMDQGRNDLWRLLADKFVNDTAPPVGGIGLLPSSVDAESVKVSWRAVDHATGVDHYRVQVRRIGGSWTSWLKRTTATSARFAGKVDTRYEFRVRAVDLKGNAQPWISTPARPRQVESNAFATVVTSSLNVRSGPSTGHAIIGTAAGGDVVYVLEGPVSGSGYQWFRVQYGFSEWPSADYPNIGWMALASAEGDYLEPAIAPTRPRLSPFVREVVASAYLSPNGDGASDSAAIGFRLKDAASSVRVEILDGAGSVRRTIDLGARPAGDVTTSWDGRLAGGGVAPEGAYRPRVVAIDGDGRHVGRAGSARMQLDLTRPRVRSTNPADGVTHHPAADRVIVSFGEPVSGTGPAGVYVRTQDGTPLDATNLPKGNGTRVVIVPDRPLPTDALLTVVVTSQVRDAAGNRHAGTATQFRTAPGVTYDPSRAAILLRGRHRAYDVGSNARIEESFARRLSDREMADVGQRSRMANLPGRWLYVTGGRFRGYWLRESAAAHLRGQTERTDYPADTRIRIQAGTYVGYRFDASGAVTRTLQRTVTATTTAEVDGRRIVNGVAYFSVVGGPWDGYLLAESRHIHRRGAIDRISFPDLPRIVLAAGTHTGYRYRPGGTIQGRVTDTLTSAARAHARAWAIINGVPHFLLDDGTWAGTWVPESSAVWIGG